MSGEPRKHLYDIGQHVLYYPAYSKTHERLEAVVTGFGTPTPTGFHRYTIRVVGQTRRAWRSVATYSLHAMEPVAESAN